MHSTGWPPARRSNHRVLTYGVVVVVVLLLAALGSVCAAEESTCCPEADELLAFVASYWVPQMRDIVLNEFESNALGNDNGAPDDWVELYNRGTAAVDISGWYALACYVGSDGKHFRGVRSNAVPDGTTLQPGAFLILRGSGNWLQNEVERVCLVAKLGSEMTFVADAAICCGDGCVNPYGQAFTDDVNDERTWQRSPDGGPGWWLLGAGTPSASNRARTYMPILFSRMQYGPEPFGGQLDEYAEVANLGTSVVDLGGWVLEDLGDERQRFTLPEWQLGPGETVRIYTGAVPPEAQGIGLGRASPIWNNRMPDTALLWSAPAWSFPSELSAQTQYWTDWALAAVWLSIAWGEVE